MLYQPTQEVYINEKLLEVPPENVVIPISDTDGIHAWYFENKYKVPFQPTILFFHGNGQNLTAHFYSLFWILDYGYNFLIIDYPGYGKSLGSPSPKNTVQAGVAAIQWLQKNHPKSKVAIFAQSLGGPIAMRSLIDMKDEFKACQLTLDSTFISYQDVARSALSKSWLTWILQPLAYVLLSDTYSPEDRLDELGDTPKLILHGEGDPVIDVKFGRELGKELPDPKELIVFKDNWHISGFHGPAKNQLRRKYLEELKACKKK